jgi:hypothetical protein
MYGEGVAATTNGGVSGGSRQGNQKIHA